MKFKKYMIAIFGIMIPIIMIICFVINLSVGNVEATAQEVKNEQELVNMVASLSAVKDSNNEYNANIIQEEIDKYIGEGKAIVTQEGDSIYVTYAKTGNRYVITGNAQYTIAYNTNGGTGSIENQIKKHGYRIALSSNEVIRTGYTFLGWDTDSSAVTVKYQPGQTFMENGNTTLYAVWTQKPTIKYDANGGENAPGIQIKEPGIDTTLSTIIPTREGYTFLGWSTDSTATTAEYQPGDEYTEDVSLELYAVWNENYLTVNYYSNYATDSFSGAANTVSSSTNILVRTAKFYYDDAYTDGLHNYSSSSAGTYLGRTGYTATGKWGTTTSGGILVSEATSFANGQALAEAFSKDITTGNESIDVYAQWTAKTIVVTFNKNDGSGTTATQTFTYGVSGQSFSNKNWTRSGYTLLGWATSSSATTTNYSTLSGVGNDWINTNSPSTTLYAVWSAKTVKVTFNKNDGSGTTATQTFTYGVNNQSFSNKNWSRAGYELLGWATNSSVTTATYPTLNGVSNDWINMNAPSITLYAVWNSVEKTLITNWVVNDYNSGETETSETKSWDVSGYDYAEIIINNTRNYDTAGGSDWLCHNRTIINGTTYNAVSGDRKYTINLNGLSTLSVQLVSSAWGGGLSGAYPITCNSIKLYKYTEENPTVIVDWVVNDYNSEETEISETKSWDVSDYAYAEIVINNNRNYDTAEYPDWLCHNRVIINGTTYNAVSGDRKYTINLEGVNTLTVKLISSAWGGGLSGAYPITCKSIKLYKDTE